MIGTLARLALLLFVIWLVVEIVRRARPRRKHLITYLEFPRSQNVDLLEAGDTVNLWPAENTPVINVYNGEVHEDNLLGQLPSRYFRDIEPVLRRGSPYLAVVDQCEDDKVRLNINLRKMELPDEFV